MVVVKSDAPSKKTCNVHRETEIELCWKVNAVLKPSDDERGTTTLSYCSDCSSLPGLNRTALPGGMATSAPVRGLRPMPVLRGRTLKIPKPRNSMRSPCDRARFMLSKTVSTAISALVLVIPVLLTTSLMMSSLITVSPSAAPKVGANLMIGLGLLTCQAASTCWELIDASGNSRRHSQINVFGSFILSLGHDKPVSFVRRVTAFWGQ